MRLVLREQVSESDADSSFNYYPPPSLSFSQLVVKLAARLMYSLKDKYSLKDLCGGTIEFGNADRTLRVLVHILLPLCIRLGSGSKGIVEYIILHGINDELKQATFFLQWCFGRRE